MTITIRARFDGEVLRPEEPPPLEPETTYVLTIMVEFPDAVPAGPAPSNELANGNGDDVPTRLGHIADERDADAAEDANGGAEEYPLTTLRRMAVDMGVEDFAERHDWYAHGRLPDDAP